MPHIRWFFLTALVCIALLSACNPASAPSSGDASASQTAEVSARALVPTGTPTPTSTITLTPTPSPSPTITTTPTPNRTATQAARNATKQASATAAAAQATEQAQPMLELVQKLSADDLLDTTDGEYYQLADLDESWAQINYFFSYLTGRSPKNFVLRANASWWSASDKANWFSSGCGIEFRMTSLRDTEIIWLGMDGYVNSARSLKGNHQLLARKKYSQKLELPHDTASIMLVVNETTIAFYVNDEQVILVHDRLMLSNPLSAGQLGLVIFSGTNKGYGTRCKMTNIEVWELSSPESPGEAETHEATVWKKIPIMPGASAGFEHKDGNSYFYGIKAQVEEVQAFYEEEMPKLGWKSLLSSMPGLALIYPDSLVYEKGDQFLVVTITQDEKTPSQVRVVIDLGVVFQR